MAKVTNALKYIYICIYMYMYMFIYIHIHVCVWVGVGGCVGVCVFNEGITEHVVFVMHAIVFIFEKMKYRTIWAYIK